MEKVMKMTKVLGCVATVLMLAPALAQAGADNSGGGDTELSTVKQVEAAVFQAAFKVDGLFEYGCKQSCSDEVAQAIKSKIDLAKLRDGSLYTLKATGSCADGMNNDHAGGAIIGDAKTPFCLSVQQLQKLPPSELVAQIAALMGHEMAHQAGYNEQDAAKFQGYLLRRLRSEENQSQVMAILSWTKDSVAETLALLDSNAPLNQVCATLGATSSYVQSLSHLGCVFAPSGDQSLSSAEAADWEIRTLLGALQTREYMTYCGLPARPSEMPDKPVAVGDTRDLKNSLAELQVIMSELSNRMNQLYRL
jgi:hypothetical protein